MGYVFSVLQLALTFLIMLIAVGVLSAVVVYLGFYYWIWG